MSQVCKWKEKSKHPPGVAISSVCKEEPSPHHRLSISTDHNQLLSNSAQPSQNNEGKSLNGLLSWLRAFFPKAGNEIESQ